MLYGALPTMPVSELRSRQAEIIEQLQGSPVLLTQHGHGAGVLVHPRVWNHLLEVYQKAQRAGLLDYGQVMDWEEAEPLLLEGVDREPALA
jgi:PHD/YefM family antitoxin component YafN of YafNO toxin-antitoxin module